MWGLPWSGMEPPSPALVGGFSTTEPPGSPQAFVLMLLIGSCPVWHSVHISLPLRCQLVTPICSLSTIFSPSRGLEELAGHTLGAPVKLLDVIWLLWCPHRSWSWNLSSTSPEIEVQRCGSHSAALTVVSKVFMLGYLDGVCLSRDFQLPGKRLPKPWWTPAGSTLLQQLQALWFPYRQPWGRNLQCSPSPSFSRLFCLF